MVGGDRVERRQQAVDVLVLDEPARKEHIVAFVRAGRRLDLCGVDAVRHDFDRLLVGPDGGEPVGGTP